MCWICYEALWVSRQASNCWCPYCYCILCFSTSAEVEYSLVVGSDAHLATSFCLNFELNSASSLSPRYVMFPSLQLPHHLPLRALHKPWLPLSPACPWDLQQVSRKCNACVRHVCVHVCLRMCMHTCMHLVFLYYPCISKGIYVDIPWGECMCMCASTYMCVFAYSPLCSSPSHSSEHCTVYTEWGSKHPLSMSTSQWGHL